MGQSAPISLAGERAPQTSDMLIAEIPSLRRYAYALTRNIARGDDLVQSCLVRAIANIGRFEAGTNLRGWLMTIMHNIFIDDVRKAKRERDNDQAAERMLSGHYTRPNQMENLQLGELEKALARLPEQQRTTLLLVALEDMSYEQAAKVTGVPVGTVRSRLSRARHALMDIIDGLNLDDLASASCVIRRHQRPARREMVMGTAIHPDN